MKRKPAQPSPKPRPRPTNEDAAMLFMIQHDLHRIEHRIKRLARTEFRILYLLKGLGNPANLQSAIEQLHSISSGQVEETNKIQQALDAQKEP